MRDWTFGLQSEANAGYEYHSCVVSILLSYVFASEPSTDTVRLMVVPLLGQCTIIPHISLLSLLDRSTWYHVFFGSVHYIADALYSSVASLEELVSLRCIISSHEVRNQHL